MKRFFFILSFLFTVPLFSQREDYSKVEQFVQLSDDLYLKGMIKKIKPKYNTDCILFGDTVKSTAYKIVVLVEVGTGNQLFLGGPHTEPKKVSFEVNLIKDSNGLYRNKMLKETKNYYQINQDSVEKLFLFKDEFQDSLFIKKSFLLRNNMTVLYQTDDLIGKGFYYIICVKNTIIKITLKNYKYTKGPTYHSCYPLTSFVDGFYISAADGNLINLMYDSSNRELVRRLFQEGILDK